MATILEHSRAALVGALIGDIRAAEYEHKKAAEIAEMLAQAGGRVVPRDYVSPWDKSKQKIIRKDQPTDDSELAARLATSLMLNRGFEPESVYKQLRAFIVERESILADEAFGSGSVLRAALEPPTYAASRDKFSRGEVPLNPSNGALMRNAPIAVRYQGDEESLARYARWQSCITHMHPLSQAACIAHALTLSYVLGGFAPAEAWEQTKGVLRKPAYRKVPELPAILAIEPIMPDQSMLWVPNDSGGLDDHTGHVGLSLRIALWAATAPSYEEGIERCIRIGGDTDTYAAIAGSLLGAHFGVEGIPDGWRNAAQGAHIMQELAERLCSERQAHAA